MNIKIIHNSFFKLLAKKLNCKLLFVVYWPTCQFLLVTLLALQMVSAFNVVAITTTRYLAIAHPLAAKAKVTEKPCLVAVGVTWVLGFFISIASYAKKSGT